MFTLLVIFVSVCLVGAGFWFFNRKQINNLVENIDDKQAIINALQSHVEIAQSTPTPRKSKNVDKRRNYKKSDNTTSSNRKTYKQRKPKTQK
jgi:hypothetical protein